MGLKLELYSDADWGVGEDRRSISAYLLILAEAAVTWKGKKQIMVIISLT